MRLVVDQKVLSKALGQAMLASGRGAKDAALANVLIISTGTSATVESYDMHIFSRAPFPCSGDPGEFAIDGTRLDHLVSSADEGNVEFEVLPDGVKVSFGRAAINLRTFPVDKYVRMGHAGIRTLATAVRSQLLLSAVEFVRPFIGKDTQKPSQMNAELRNGRFLAGDGTRIGVVKVDAFEFRLKIPNAVIGSVTRWIKEATGCGSAEAEARNLQIQETEDFHYLSVDGTESLAWRKPEHDFTAIEPFLDQFEASDASRTVFKVDRESLQRMVGSLSVVLESGAERVGFAIGDAEQPMLIGTALDSRGVQSQNQVQVVVDARNGENTFALRYTHLLETLKLTTNPVITCDVRRDKSIMRISETHPEMQKIALLTLMTD